MPAVERAHGLIKMRVRRGTVVPQPCAICGASPGHAHHPDYDRPAVVIWLCRPHHAGVHSGEYPKRFLRGLEIDTGPVRVMPRSA